MYNKIVVQDLEMNVLVECSKMFEKKISAKFNVVRSKHSIRKYIKFGFLEFYQKLHRGWAAQSKFS